jgi:hypothetical protein
MNSISVLEALERLHSCGPKQIDTPERRPTSSIVKRLPLGSFLMS